MGSSVDWTWLRKESASLDRLTETLQTNMKRQNGRGNNNKKQQHIQEFWGNYNWCIKRVIKIPGGLEENGAEKLLELIVAGYCPKFMTSNKPHI